MHDQRAFGATFSQFYQPRTTFKELLTKMHRVAKVYRDPLLGIKRFHRNPLLLQK